MNEAIKTVMAPAGAAAAGTVVGKGPEGLSVVEAVAIGGAADGLRLWPAGAAEHAAKLMLTDSAASRLHREACVFGSLPRCHADSKGTQGQASALDTGLVR